jgi:hypothetical protein
MLHRTYERLILHASLDPVFGAQLIKDPAPAAQAAGYSPLLAESLVGLRSTSVQAFAAALHERVYGEQPGGLLAAAGGAVVPVRRRVRQGAGR